MTSKNSYPEYVSFADAAKIVVRQGLAGSMTSQGLRYIARSRANAKGSKRWPFGDGPSQDPYLMASKTRLMRTTKLLKYLEKHPPIGRGPARKPRKKKAGGS